MSPLVSIAASSSRRGRGVNSGGGGGGGEDETYFGASVAALPDAAVIDYSLPTGDVHTVTSASNFQDTLDDAAPGDIIILPNNADYVGTFVFPAKTGSSYNPIYVMSQRHYDGGGPAEGVRATSNSGMPTLRPTYYADPAVQMRAAGVTGWRLIDVHLTQNASIPQQKILVEIGDPYATYTNTDQTPANVCLDRCVLDNIDGTTSSVQRGVWIQANNVVVRDCTIDECFSRSGEVTAGDGQCVNVYDYARKVLVDNCYLGGATETFFAGGYGDGIPQDVTLRRSYLTQYEDQASFSNAKNLLECKSVKRWLVEDTVLGYHEAGETHLAITIKCDWGDVNDVIFRNMKAQDVCGGFTIANVSESSSITRIVVDNFDLGLMTREGSALVEKIFAVLSVGAPNNIGTVKVHRVSGVMYGDAGGWYMMTQDGICDLLEIKNCITYHSSNPNYTYNKPLVGRVTGLDERNGSNVFAGNLVIGGSTSTYNAYGNEVSSFPTSYTDSDLFVDVASGDLTLKSDSPYKGVGADGADPGADVATIDTRTSGCVTGDWS